jgi:signal transduction histidine kinase
MFWRYGALIICAFLSGVIFISCFFIANSYRKSLENNFRRETSNIAKLLIDQFDTTVNYMDSLLLHIASEYPSIDTNGSEKLQQLHELLKNEIPQKLLSIGIIGITDKNGMIVATSSAYPFTPLDATDRAFFTYHATDLSHSSLYISAPEFGRLSKKWVVLFSRPLRNKDGAFDGVVQASYFVSDFLRLFENLDIRGFGLASFVGRDGIALVRSANGKLSYGTKIPASSVVFNKILSGVKQGSFDEITAFDHKRRIGYFIVSGMSPFHAYVGYDYSNIQVEYDRAVVVLGVIWILFSAIILGSVLFVQKIETLRQQSRVAAIEAISVERKRILSDMHDSIGASLAVLISHLNPSGGDWVRLRRKATQILTELRLLVDSVGEQETDINAVLTSVRHRMRSGLELADIKVIWRVVQIPKTLSLAPHDALSLRLILMEALSNLMHHSRANTTVFSTTYENAARLLTISVSDDGCGFVTTPSSEGFGLKNMKARAKKLTWLTTIHIDSVLGKGTTVQIKMELPVGLT